jgi:DNA-directed RNA polymerase specialized sigma24 family protein
MTYAHCASVVTKLADAFARAEQKPRRFAVESPKVRMSESQLRYAMAVCRRCANSYRDHAAVSRDDLFQAGMDRIMHELVRRPDLHDTNAWMGRCAEYAIKRELRRLWGYTQIVTLSNGGDDGEGNEFEDQALAIEEENEGVGWILDVLTPRERKVALLSALKFTPEEITRVMTFKSTSNVASTLKAAQEKLVSAGVRLKPPSKLEQWVHEYRSICAQQEAMGMHANYSFRRDGTPRDGQRDLHRKELAVRKSTITKSLKRHGIDPASLLSDVS